MRPFFCLKTICLIKLPPVIIHDHRPCTFFRPSGSTSGPTSFSSSSRMISWLILALSSSKPSSERTSLCSTCPASPILFLASPTMASASLMPPALIVGGSPSTPIGSVFRSTVCCSLPLSKRTTMQERLSVEKRARAWSTSSLEACWGSWILRIRSTASWSVQTSHN